MYTCILQGCLKTCYQRHLISRCKCGDASIPMEGIIFSNVGTILPCISTNFTQGGSFSCYIIHLKWFDCRLRLCIRTIFYKSNQLYMYTIIRYFIDNVLSCRRMQVWDFRSTQKQRVKLWLSQSVQVRIESWFDLVNNISSWHIHTFPQLFAILIDTLC